MEIGSYTGRSTCSLASRSKRTHREKVTAVDHFLGSQEQQQGGAQESPHVLHGDIFSVFLENLRKATVDDWVHPLCQDSVEAAKSWSHPIRLLFMDGDHSYDDARADFEAWSPRLISKGLVAFHDIEIFDGVTRSDAALLRTGLFREVLSVGTLRVVSRTGKTILGGGAGGA